MDNIEYPIIKKAYLKAIHKDSFRRGEMCEVVAVRNMKPSNDLEYRIVYEVRFIDGVTDYIAIQDVEEGTHHFVLSEMRP
jgi:hypothetical protein